MRSLRHASLPAVLAAALACSSSGSASTPAGVPAPDPVRVDAPSGTLVDMSLTRSDPTTRHAVDAPPDAVWGALPGVYAELGIPVTTVVTSARRIGNPTYRARRRLAGERISRFLSCGERLGQRVADTDDVTLRVETVVGAGEGGGAELVTVVSGSARPTGVAGHPINCSTTGLLEQRILELVQAKVKR